MGNWFVLFVRTGKEEKVTSFLNAHFDRESRAFVPMVNKIHRKAGKNLIETSICFPGYVFIDSNKSCIDFLQCFKELYGQCKDVLSVLNYGSTTDIKVHDYEQNQLMLLCNSNYNIEESIGIIEGEHIRVISGALRGLESTIKKIDRHKREARIDMYILGSHREITVGLEIVRKAL